MKNFKEALNNNSKKDYSAKKDYTVKDYKIAIYNIDFEYDEDYVVQTLYIQHIAKVKRIIMIPYVNIDDGEVYKVAYIDVHEWNTDEYARNFIKMMKHCPEGYSLYLYHYYNLGWPVTLIHDTDIVFEMGYDKINSTYYSLEYYKNIDWDEESDTMELVKAEFIAKQCAENVLDC